MFCFAAGATHLLSALGHIYPDSHSLEKADHLGIVALIIGNPISSLMVRPCPQNLFSNWLWHTCLCRLLGTAQPTIPYVMATLLCLNARQQPA
jgi:predicted membrane channel-forming protein YqfA (hemolysin III family)